MIFVLSYIGMIVFLVVIVYMGVKSGKLQKLFERKPKLPKALLFGYIVFTGCFVFPIRSEPFPLDIQGVYLLLSCYGVIALAFAGLFGSGRGVFVYGTTFLLTVLGMGCRYLLEFGEVSNTYNFTLFNIVSYLVLIPAGTCFAYDLIVRKMKRS